MGFPLKMQAECEFENLYFGRKYLHLFQDFASNYVVEVFVYWSIIVTNIASNILITVMMITT